jgi:hypothetical protein
MTKPLVIIESPYAGDVERNLEYARAALHDSLTRGEAPYASHLLYTQKGVLDDNIPDQREAGIIAGHAWVKAADLVAVYRDFGISPGMEAGIRIAKVWGKPVIYRSLKAFATKVASSA